MVELSDEWERPIDETGRFSLLPMSNGSLKIAELNLKREFSVNVSENGKLIEEKKEEINSFPIEFNPFLEHHSESFYEPMEEITHLEAPLNVINAQIQELGSEKFVKINSEISVEPFRSYCLSIKELNGGGNLMKLDISQTPIDFPHLGSLHGIMITNCDEIKLQIHNSILNILIQKTKFLISQEQLNQTSFKIRRVQDQLKKIEFVFGQIGENSIEVLFHINDMWIFQAVNFIDQGLPNEAIKTCNIPLYDFEGNLLEGLHAIVLFNRENNKIELITSHPLQIQLYQIIKENSAFPIIFKDESVILSNDGFTENYLINYKG